MHRGGTLIVSAIFLGFSAAASGQQTLAAPGYLQSGNQTVASIGPECSRAPRDPVQPLDRDARAIPAPRDSGGTPEANLADAPTVDLEQDLKFLQQRQAELANCLLAANAQGEQDDPTGDCFGQLALNFEMRHDGEPERDVPIGRLPGTAPFFYESGMTIDADGAPNAYHPDNLGLDDLANAGSPGNWQGLAKDANGEPFVQGPDDPFPGYYVSATALADRTKPPYDPTRYVDASKIPFVVLPGWMARQLGARPGDFAVVFNQRNAKSSYAIFGDVGPADRIGEGSMALAENLGIRSDARNGGARRGVLYLVFPGSGNGRPRTIEEINAEGLKLLHTWEGSIPLTACAEDSPARLPGGSQSTN